MPPTNILFRVSGFAADNGDEFEGLVYARERFIGNEVKIGQYKYTDDDIMFYGLNEKDIKNKIKTEDAIDGIWIITSYKKIY